MSAVLKSKSIETIFDYNLNDAELNTLLGNKDDRLDKQDYLDLRSDNGILADLYRLFNLRGNKKQANSYLNKINDNDFKDRVKLPCCVVA